MTMQARSKQVIERLRAVYQGDRFQFDLHVSQFIAGDHNKELRREIVLQVTGETRPLSKCGMYAVADVLKNSFDQLTLAL